jgi:hypothetical protein
VAVVGCQPGRRCGAGRTNMPAASLPTRNPDVCEAVQALVGGQLPVQADDVGIDAAAELAQRGVGAMATTRPFWTHSPPLDNDDDLAHTDIGVVRHG